jgi:hypothetical protein
LWWRRDVLGYTMSSGMAQLEVFTNRYMQYLVSHAHCPGERRDLERGSRDLQV